MTTTPRLGATDWAAAQASPWVVHNAFTRRAEAGAARYPVADRVTDPPVTCADGASYIIIATATGAFAGKEDQIATAVGVNAASGWLYTVLGTLHEGTVAYVQDEDVEYKWSGSAWAAQGAVPTEASAVEIWTGSATAKYVSPDKLSDAQAPTALASSASITPDFNAGANFTLTLAHNTTLQNPSNLQAGDSGVIVITQDAGAPFTMAYGTQWKFPGGAPVLSTGAGAVDAIAFYAVTTSFIIANLTKAYSS